MEASQSSADIVDVAQVASFEEAQPTLASGRTIFSMASRSLLATAVKNASTALLTTCSSDLPIPTTYAARVSSTHSSSRVGSSS